MFQCSGSTKPYLDLLGLASTPCSLFVHSADTTSLWVVGLGLGALIQAQGVLRSVAVVVAWVRAGARVLMAVQWSREQLEYALVERRLARAAMQLALAGLAEEQQLEVELLEQQQLKVGQAGKEQLGVGLVEGQQLELGLLEEQRLMADLLEGRRLEVVRMEMLPSEVLLAAMGQTEERHVKGLVASQERCVEAVFAETDLARTPCERAGSNWAKVECCCCVRLLSLYHPASEAKSGVCWAWTEDVVRCRQAVSP